MWLAALDSIRLPRRSTPDPLDDEAPIVTWAPISRNDLDALVARDLAECPPDEAAFFSSIAAEPVKWSQSPFGDEGGGFWVIGIWEDNVLWYNDIEEGFNISCFETPGTIPASEYWCNQDTLHFAFCAFHRGARRAAPPEPL